MYMLWTIITDVLCSNIMRISEKVIILLVIEEYKHSNKWLINNSIHVFRYGGMNTVEPDYTDNNPRLFLDTLIYCPPYLPETLIEL